MDITILLFYMNNLRSKYLSIMLCQILGSEFLIFGGKYVQYPILL